MNRDPGLGGVQDVSGHGPFTSPARPTPEGCVSLMDQQELASDSTGHSFVRTTLSLEGDCHLFTVLRRPLQPFWPGATASN
jgi:hypothetical protein